MFWQRVAGSSVLVVAMSLLGCATPSEDPVQAAEVFLELAESASEEQFLNLYDVLQKKLCAEDRAILERRTKRFMTALPPEIQEHVHLRASDLITGLDLPRNLKLDKGHSVSLTPSSMRVDFPAELGDGTKRTLAITMVLEDKSWRACNIVASQASL